MRLRSSCIGSFRVTNEKPGVLLATALTVEVLVGSIVLVQVGYSIRSRDTGLFPRNGSLVEEQKVTPEQSRRAGYDRPIPTVEYRRKSHTPKRKSIGVVRVWRV